MLRTRKQKTGRLFRSVRPGFEQLEVRQLLSVFTVTTVVDNGNNAMPTVGSLRKAILDANGHANPPTGIDSIAFNISGTGIRTIRSQFQWPEL